MSPFVLNLSSGQLLLSSVLALLGLEGVLAYIGSVWISCTTESSFVCTSVVFIELFVNREK